MTTRLYYTDAERRVFDAVVVRADVVDGRVHAILDQTAFYPTSGGQPFDVGTIGDADVLDVLDTDDGEIVHVLSAPVTSGASVRGEIEWARRFDHMQQHTGQHMLSAAFDRLLGVMTTSFHLGADAATIDLAREVSMKEIADAEAMANRVVWDDRPVTVRFVDQDEAARLPLRRTPPRGGTLRLVDIADFDLSACGGTHVGRTGSVGMIAVTGVERMKGASRVSFACGGRALRSHAALRDVVTGATRALSVVPLGLVAAIEKSQSESRDATRLITRLRDDLARYRAVELRATAEAIGPHRVVLCSDPDLDVAALKSLASAVVNVPGFIAVLVGGGSPVPFVVTCSAGTDVNASAIVRDVATSLGGRGGGSPTMAQGGVPSASSVVIEYVKQRLSATP